MRRRVPAGAGPLAASEIERIRRGGDDWVPQAALNFSWQRVDPIHGRGGTHVGGRPRRPDDPDRDGWTLQGFAAALERDRAEITDVVASHPEHGRRLERWLMAIEALGRRRDRDPAIRNGSGAYYIALQALGYSVLADGEGQ